MYDILELKKKKLQNLQEIAGELEISEIKNYKKMDLIYQILDKQATSPNNKNEKVIGTGLGLSIVSEATKSLKGNLKVSKLKGNVFCAILYLPLS